MKTLSKALEISGIGLHSGEMCRVRISPYDRPGIFFKNAGGISDAAEAVVEEDRRLTGFSLPNGMKIRTGEHMLAAIARISPLGKATADDFESCAHPSG